MAIIYNYLFYYVKCTLEIVRNSYCYHYDCKTFKMPNAYDSLGHIY